MENTPPSLAMTSVEINDTPIGLAAGVVAIAAPLEMLAAAATRGHSDLGGDRDFL
jgi:hypothetical protein